MNLKLFLRNKKYWINKLRLKRAKYRTKLKKMYKKVNKISRYKMNKLMFKDKIVFNNIRRKKN